MAHSLNLLLPDPFIYKTVKTPLNTMKDLGLAIFTVVQLPPHLQQARGSPLMTSLEDP